MRQTEDIKAFKNELSNYHFYKKRVAKLQELIDYCYHMLGGIKGIDTTKEPSQSHIKNLDAEYKIRDEIEHHTRNLESTEIKIRDINDILNKIKEDSGQDVMDATFSMYADKKTAVSLGDKYGYSPSSIQYVINKAIKKALDR